MKVKILIIMGNGLLLKIICLLVCKDMRNVNIMKLYVEKFFNGLFLFIIGFNDSFYVDFFFRLNSWGFIIRLVCEYEKIGILFLLFNVNIIFLCFC